MNAPAGYRLASAERLAESGQTDEEISAKYRTMGAKLARSDLVLINLQDAGLTQSQYERALKLMRELYPSVK